jgi:hypothetical protein
MCINHWNALERIHPFVTHHSGQTSCRSDTSQIVSHQTMFRHSLVSNFYSDGLDLSVHNCITSVWALSGLHLTNVIGVSQLSQWSLQISDWVLTTTWPVSNWCLANVWPLPDLCQIDVLPTSDLYLSCVQPMSQLCLTCIWLACNQYLQCNKGWLSKSSLFWQGSWEFCWLWSPFNRQLQGDL